MFNFIFLKITYVGDSVKGFLRSKCVDVAVKRKDYFS